MTYEKIKSLGHIIPQGYQPRLDYLKVIDEVYIKAVSYTHLILDDWFDFLFVKNHTKKQQ